VIASLCARPKFRHRCVANSPPGPRLHCALSTITAPLAQVRNDLRSSSSPPQPVAHHGVTRSFASAPQDVDPRSACTGCTSTRSGLRLRWIDDATPYLRTASATPVILFLLALRHQACCRSGGWRSGTPPRASAPAARSACRSAAVAMRFTVCSQPPASLAASPCAGRGTARICSAARAVSLEPVQRRELVELHPAEAGRGSSALSRARFGPRRRAVAADSVLLLEHERHRQPISSVVQTSSDTRASASVDSRCLRSAPR